LITRAKLWTIGVLGCLGALILAALLWPHQSFRLTAFSDVIQCILLLSGMISFLPRAVGSQGRMRLFWALISLGIAFWLSYQLLWTYFEVWLHRDVPDLYTGDIVLFLHIVPLMAALALRPHLQRDEYAARLGRLDFALLMIWWVYLYVLIVMPWQYAVANLEVYSRNLNAVYLAEKVVFLSALVACIAGSKGPWRTFYASLFGASFTYAASSYLANWAIARNVYYSGSLYDLPLATAMASLTLIGVWTPASEPAGNPGRRSPAYGVWVARCGMIAAFSLPLFGAWPLFDMELPPRVRYFRLGVTLAAALLMGIMVFIRQHLLDRELFRLLKHSRESVDNLMRLQAQIVESEKMASIGQLVGGAAHELNNPITAMLGYSELLLATELNMDQLALAAKIGQHVRRTRSLVASLLNFARQAPSSKAPLDLNTLVRTAVKLAQPQWDALKIEVRLELDHDILRVLGDSNQLLQVCLQVIGDALYGMSERGGRALTITSRRQQEIAVLVIAGDSPANTLTDSSSQISADSLGLSACQAIVQEHHGRMIRGPQGGTTVSIELPLYVPGAISESALPALWPALPSA